MFPDKDYITTLAVVINLSMSLTQIGFLTPTDICYLNLLCPSYESH